MENENPIGSLSRSYVILSIILFALLGYFIQTSLPSWFMGLIGAVMSIPIYFGIQFLIRSLLPLVQKIPRSTIVALLTMLSLAALARYMGFRLPTPLYYGIILFSMLCLALLHFQIPRYKKDRSMVSLLLSLAGLVGIACMVFLLAFRGKKAETQSTKGALLNSQLLSESGLVNPALAGKFKFQSMTYSPGTDHWREEYGTSTTIKSKTVDATRLLPDWKGKKKKWRERYWKFGPKEFPLNGRISLPEGEGPFPLVLIVHGNHNMIDYSDDGYGYLTELMASHGVIGISVDQNFINGHWSGDFRGKEMPTRAWLLLKHIELLQEWNQTAGHKLYQKIDEEKIALVGHSRGGEAVNIAAAFNTLSHFPDDALEAFDFNYNIKGIVSIAPTDYRYHREISLMDINYLSLQGSYDADESSFWGLRPFHRLSYSGEEEYIKAGVYIHRANHGQFNSTWGDKDFGGAMAWTLNRAPLMLPVEQQEVAKVSIMSFIQYVLLDNPSYLPILKNTSYGKDWLPDYPYLNHYRSTADVVLENFEGDIRLNQGNYAASMQAEDLAIWREEELKTQNGESLRNNCLILGWDTTTDSLQSLKPSFSFNFDNALELRQDSFDYFFLELGQGSLKELKSKNKKLKSDSMNLAIRFHWNDQNENSYQVMLNEIQTLTPILKSQLMKWNFLEKDMFGERHEIQMEYFKIPLKAFGIEQTLPVASLKNVSFELDASPFGIMAIDNLGLGRD